MEKQIYNEKTGLWYVLRRDHYFPVIDSLPEEERPVSVWGQRHAKYLRKHKKAVYAELAASGRFHDYLVYLNDRAEAMYRELVKQMAAKEHVDEDLKAQNQRMWVEDMNYIMDRAMEMVCSDLIYA